MAITRRGKRIGRAAHNLRLQRQSKAIEEAALRAYDAMVREERLAAIREAVKALRRDYPDKWEAWFDDDNNVPETLPLEDLDAIAEIALRILTAQL